MRAGDIMTKYVVSVSPETPASRVVTLCLTEGTSGLPVVDHEHRVVGMIGQGNLVRGSRESTERRALWLYLLAAGMKGGERLAAEAGDLTAKQIMDSEFVVSEDTAPIEEVAQLLVDRDANLLPVVRESRLVGIIGRSDVLEAFVKLAQKGIKNR
jgi:predicted transcriptional regulator